MRWLLGALLVGTFASACEDGSAPADPRAGATAEAGSGQGSEASLGVAAIAEAGVTTFDLPSSDAENGRRVNLPRFPFAGALSLIWTRTSFEEDTVLLYPTDVQFSAHGLLVFDAGSRQVRVFESSTGRLVSTLGREGRGPGELSPSFWFQGSYDRPVSFDATQRRLTHLARARDSMVTLPFPRNRRWMSTCALDDSLTLGYASATSAESDVLLAVGERVVDSMSNPFEELRAEHFMARQVIVRQLDDSSCAVLTAYQRQFAVIERNRTVRLGVYPESSTVMRVDVVISDNGKSVVSSLPRGARVGPADARAWREYLLVLFRGRTTLAERTIDVFAREDLTYQGSLVLPTKAKRMTVRGDSLIVIGERNDYPTLALLILRPAKTSKR